MSKLLNLILNIFFPTHCVICEEQGPDLCKKCMDSFESAKPTNYDWITSIWNYRDPNVEKLMRYIKNHPNERILLALSENTPRQTPPPLVPRGTSSFQEEESAPHTLESKARVAPLGKRSWLATASSQTEELDEIIIPIPIHRKRFRERGYNQSELIASAFSKKWNIPVLKNVLYKSRTTHKQGTTKSKQERAENLKDSFAIKNNHLIKDRTIILIDDITTTGSTLVEARKVLLDAGAKKVFAVTLAN